MGKYNKSKFFTFTIQGDNLDVVAAKETIGLPCKIFTKGQKSFTKWLKTEVVSRSTRWVYESILQDKTNANVFLLKNLEIIREKMPEIKKFIKGNKVLLDLVIYDDTPRKNHVILNRKIIKLLSEIDMDLSIVFF